MSKKMIAGSPMECGSGLFTQIVAPAIKVSAKAMDKDQLFMLYAGFFSAMYGAMLYDFGKSQADSMIEVLVKKFAEMPDPATTKMH